MSHIISILVLIAFFIASLYLLYLFYQTVRYFIKSDKPNTSKYAIRFFFGCFVWLFICVVFVLMFGGAIRIFLGSIL